jgi:mono/diheme cytochrome c family protein
VAMRLALAAQLSQQKSPEEPKFHALRDFGRLFQKSCGECHMLSRTIGQSEGV